MEGTVHTAWCANTVHTVWCANTVHTVWCANTVHMLCRPLCQPVCAGHLTAVCPFVVGFAPLNVYLLFTQKGGKEIKHWAFCAVIIVICPFVFVSLQ